MKKRIFSLLLAALLVLLCIAVSGCKEPVESQNSSVSSESGAQSGTDESSPDLAQGRFYGLDIPESLDFGGKTVKVLTTGTAASPTTHQIQPNNNDQINIHRRHVVSSLIFVG